MQLTTIPILLSMLNKVLIDEIQIFENSAGKALWRIILGRWMEFLKKHQSRNNNLHTLIEIPYLFYTDFVEEQDILEKIKDFDRYTEYTGCVDWMWKDVQIIVPNKSEKRVWKTFLWVCGMCLLNDWWPFSERLPLPC